MARRKVFLEHVCVPFDYLAFDRIIYHPKDIEPLALLVAYALVNRAFYSRHIRKRRLSTSSSVQLVNSGFIVSHVTKA
jgi:hypothetical protein